MQVVFFVRNALESAYNHGLLLKMQRCLRVIVVKKNKITIVGAGNVGATAAFIASQKQLAEIVLLDIVDGLAEGKALDMTQAGSVNGYDADVTGTCDWSKAAGSDIVIITSGMPRKPGMSRDDLLSKNVQIIKSVSENTAKYCPDSFVIVVANPLDAMVYAAAKVTGFAKNKIMGMAGVLDSARLGCFIARQLGVSTEDIKCVLMGGHGDDMVPLVRFTTVSGVPISELLSAEAIDKLVKRTRNGGIEIVNLLGYSGYYAPAAGAIKMAEAILKDKKELLSCCAYCDSEYKAGGYFVGTAAVLGKNGVEKVVELDLNEQETEQFEVSLAHVKELSVKVDGILQS